MVRYEQVNVTHALPFGRPADALCAFSWCASSCGAVCVGTASSRVAVAARTTLAACCPAWNTKDRLTGSGAVRCTTGRPRCPAAGVLYCKYMFYAEMPQMPPHKERPLNSFLDTVAALRRCQGLAPWAQQAAYPSCWPVTTLSLHAGGSAGVQRLYGWTVVAWLSWPCTTE